MMPKPIDRGWWDGTWRRKVIHDGFWYAVGIVTVIIAVGRLAFYFYPFWHAGR